MEGLIDAQEFVKYFMKHLEENDLVLARRSDVKTNQLRSLYLRKKFLTYKEIADAKFWGEIGKNAVKAIAKKQVLDHEINRSGHAYKISRHAAERIGKNRGTWPE